MALRIYSLCVLLLSLQNPVSSLSPLQILRDKMGSLYALRDQLSNSGRSIQENRNHTSVLPEPQIVTEIHQELYTTEFLRPNKDSSVLGSLYELGVKDMKTQDDAPREKSPIEAFLKEIKDLPFLPIRDANGSLELSEKDNHIKSPVLQYLDVMRGDVWAQFKSLVLGYSNWLEEEYQIQDISGKLPIALLKKFLDMGDRVNFLHVVGKRVDIGLAKHLADKLKPLFDAFESMNQGRSFGPDLSSVLNNMIRDTAWNTIHQFVDHVLHVAGRFVSKKDIEDFQNELSKSSPLVAKGLDFVLNGPPKDSLAMEEGRSLSNRKGYIEYDDGYGHGGGFGGHGSYDQSYDVYNQGYSSGVHLDPYLILGGLGAAALLAYLAYKVIVTTAGARRRRSDDLTFMELSDMPNIVYSIYNMLEGADSKYNTKLPIQLDDTDDLVNGLNSLWYEQQKETGCIRCSLFSFIRDHFSMGHNVADTLLVAGVAQLLGAEKSGQLVDEVSRAMIEGELVQCIQESNTCYFK